MKRKVTVLTTAATLLAIVLIAAACGSVGGGSAYASSPSTSAAKATAASAAAGAARVGVRNTSLGRIVVDGKGRTLYLFEKDKNHRSACAGACAAYWPPLLSRGKPLALRGVKQSLLGTSRRANGTKQVTYAGHPLYRYVGDSRPGDTTGEGLQDFGGGWDAVSPAGKKVEADG